jgi:hypothetical protein
VRTPEDCRARADQPAQILRRSQARAPAWLPAEPEAQDKQPNTQPCDKSINLKRFFRDLVANRQSGFGHAVEPRLDSML